MEISTHPSQVRSGGEVFVVQIVKPQVPSKMRLAPGQNQQPRVYHRSSQNHYQTRTVCYHDHAMVSSYSFFQGTRFHQQELAKWKTAKKNLGTGAFSLLSASSQVLCSMEDTQEVLMLSKRVKWLSGTFTKSQTFNTLTRHLKGFQKLFNNICTKTLQMPFFLHFNGR